MIAPTRVPLAGLSSLFRGLGDPARLSCLLAIRDGPRTVGEIVEVTRLSQPNVSKHLACLRECGLVHAKRDGRFMRYALSHPDVERFLDVSEGLLAEVGGSIASCSNYGERRPS